MYCAEHVNIDGLYDYTYKKDTYENTLQEQIELLRAKDIKKYRTKTIKSGPMLECEIYPIWNTNRKKEANEKIREKQKKINNANIRKKIVRLLNGNFCDSDRNTWITVGYGKGNEPEDINQAHKDVINYIRRLQRHCQKNNLPKLKYVYVTEQSETGRIHHHLVTNFEDRDLAEKLWKKGNRPQARRLQPDDYGLEGMARYISKDVSGQKRYGYSLGLYKSWEHATVADNKITRRRAERIATGNIAPKEYYEKLYPGYTYIDMEVKYSTYVSGCYIYARMKKHSKGIRSPMRI